MESDDSMALFYWINRFLANGHLGDQAALVILFTRLARREILRDAFRL